MWLSDNNADPSTVDAEIAFAKLRGAWSVWLHQDDPSALQTQNTREAADRVNLNRLKPIHAIHLVNGNRGIWYQDCLPAFSLNVQTLGGRDWNQVRRDAVYAVEMFRQGQCGIIDVIRWFACEDQELKDWLTAFMAKVPTPILLPGQSPPIVVQPPQQQPPKLGFWAKLWLKIRGKR